MEVKQPLKKFYFLFSKDIALFLRSKLSIGGIFGFAFLSVVLSSFTLGAVILPEHDRIVLAVAAAWLCFAFSTVQIFSKIFDSERLDRAVEMVLLSDVSPAFFYFAKWLASTVVVCLVQILICLLFQVFFDVRFAFLSLLLLFFLSASALSSVGVLLSAISSFLKNKEISLPILLFPLAIPILFAGVELTIKICLNQSFDYFWLIVLLAINAITLSISWLFFERAVRG